MWDSGLAVTQPAQVLILSQVYRMCVRLVNFFLFAVVDCGALQAPANGAVMTNPGTNFTSIATYICDPGFFLEGEPTRTCPATGNWTGSQPTCTGKQPVKYQK